MIRMIGKKSMFSVLIALSCSSLGLAQDHAPGVQALTNVNLIDGTGAGPQPGTTILLDGDRIAAVYATGSQPIPAEATVLDLEGKTVIPGLIDAHIHVLRFGRKREDRHAELRRMLYGGVVATREMGGDARISGEASRGILLGEIVGPDLYYSAVMGGPGFVLKDPRGTRAAAGLPVGSTGWMQAITAETDLPLAVARAAGTGAKGLKLYANLDAGLAARIVEEAQRQGLLVWSHTTIYPDRPLDYVRAGVDVTSHLCGLPWQDPDLDPSAFGDVNLHSRPTFDPQRVQPGGPEMVELFEEMVRRGTLFEPTLANQSRPGSRVGCESDLMVSLAREAARAGVTVVAGTDFVAAVEDPYPALHRELEALVEHQVLSPLEAIAAATQNAAAALGLEDTHGAVAEGKLANLVVLDGDPSQDISAIRNVAMVIKRGKIYPRTDFETAETQ